MRGNNLSTWKIMLSSSCGHTDMTHVLNTSKEMTTHTCAISNSTCTSFAYPCPTPYPTPYPIVCDLMISLVVTCSSALGYTREKTY